MAKTESMRMRLRPEEKVALQEAANLAGVPASAWIRERSRVACIQEFEREVLKVPFVQQLPMSATDG